MEMKHDIRSKFRTNQSNEAKQEKKKTNGEPLKKHERTEDQQAENDEKKVRNGPAKALLWHGGRGRKGSGQGLLA